MPGINKRGLASVFIVLILTSLIFLLFVLVEVSSGHAAGSIKENIGLLTGKSLLSEFEPDLQRRYGVFALNADSLRLEKYAKEYISEDLDSQGTLVRLKLKDCSVDTSIAEGLNVSDFAEQINRLGTFVLAKESISGSDLVQSILSASDAQNTDADDIASEIENCQADYPATSAAFRTAEDLKAQLKEAQKEDFDTGGGKAITDSAILSALPSKIEGLSSRTFLLFAGGLGQLDADTVFQNAYILSVLSDGSCPGPEGVLSAETEYVLFGYSEDKINIKKSKASLMKIRTAFNLADIASDPKVLAAINAEALAFAPIPQSVAAAAIAMIKALTKAKSDVNRLYAGATVPFFSSGKSNVTKGSLKDYFQLLLVMLPERERLLRLMDIMQMNINAGNRSNFTFQSYAYGFKLEFTLEKRSFFPSITKFRNRYGSFSQDFSYIK